MNSNSIQAIKSNENILWPILSCLVFILCFFNINYICDADYMKTRNQCEDDEAHTNQPKKKKKNESIEHMNGHGNEESMK